MTITTTKIDEFIRDAKASCQSEARAVAECLEDALEGCDEDEHADMVRSIADEFIGWGEAMRKLSACGACYEKKSSPKAIRKVSLRFYMTGNMCDNKYTLHVTSDEFGVLRYVFTGGWSDSGIGHCSSNFGLKQPLPATIPSGSVGDLADCIKTILLDGYQKAVEVVFALEVCDTCSMLESKANHERAADHPELTADEIAWTYCANEIYAGYPCRVPGCPTCGGPDTADEVLKQINEYMKPRKD